MTLYRETPCEHDYMESHYTCDHIGYPEYNQMHHTNCQCPGGSREEVTIDYGAAAGLLSTLDDIPSLAHPEEVLPFATRVVDAALHTEKEPVS